VQQGAGLDSLFSRTCRKALCGAGSTQCTAWCCGWP
jgi:hypothetical protein